ncbi:MAG TPA: tetratricopeptide repeat protein [Bacteroidia bacterium]|nr:tetratricopeptide repeat protein [Bacteroidia bacterium]
MKLKILLIICGMFFLCEAQAQNRKTDSLVQLLKTQKEDTNRINTLIQISRAIRKADPVGAMNYISEGLTLSEKLGSKKGIVKFNTIKGNVYSVTGKNDSALICYNLALKLAEEINSKVVMCTINNNIGLIYFNRGDYNKSLEYTKKVLEESSKTGEKLLHARALSNIASCYEQTKDYKTAIDFNLEGIKEFEAIHEKGISYIYGNTANLYSLVNDQVKAESYANKALDISLEEGDKMIESLSYNVLAAINNKKGNYAKAEKYAKKANVLSKEIQSKEFMKLDYQLLSEIFENKHDYKTALEYHKLFSGIQDSLYNDENLKQVMQMQQLFETEKKEKEIFLLTKEKQLQEVELEKKAEQLNKNKIVTYSIAGGSLLVFLLLVVVYSRYQLKQKANKQLEEQKKEIIGQRDEISLKNKEITDSINYAKKIQDALLPSREQLSALFPESFVLHLPKDIVSGDFFWIEVKEGQKMIAVADCTGHGVPGGFMSVLGMEKLYEAAQSCNGPAQMLKYLNVFIKKALQQNNEEANSRDGMDIILCSIDESSQTLNYSGANRPLWIVEQQKITEISPDKTAIGGHTSGEYEFKSNEIKLNKGSMVYLFSDGFADQFGGENKKKLMTKRFKELIVKASALPIKDQEKFFNKYFNEWKGALEQIDDVLVIGFTV